MPTITVSFILTNPEHRRLTLLAGTEPVDAYIQRMAFKALQGYLETQAGQARTQAIRVLAQAYDAANPTAKLAALNALGYELDADGNIRPIP
jgi:hypothetical protein